MGQLVYDPLQDIEGAVVGRATYFNGCARIYVQPKMIGNKEIKAFWVDEKQVEPKNTFFGKKKIVKEPDPPQRTSGGPAPANSRR